ncbi:branched-chain amino acid ABC transporter permease [Kyrpidia sp.]|uniref:branched-chain amino acid ABC transporter permease n=1 Tax=Kyrpidia sp. TaxID=2073077 RepID=UPI00258FD20E|nr:branched-chain amino acid ABC transporter permease [Kyrpidia sp.]MCL6575852.1 branched-chain amino acid ABC transporter permease [Kyrpidia sp.]
MTVFAQQVVNGLINGTVYALVALGLTLIYGVMNLSNFAQGEFAMVGGFGTYLLVQAGLPYPLAVAAAFLLAGAVGFVVHLLAFHPLRQNDPMTMMLSSLGVSLFLVNLAQYLFSPDPQVVHSPLSGQTLHLFGIYLSEQRLLAALVSLVLCGLIYGLLQYTSFGRSVRAASLDPDTATLYGIQTRRISILTFVLGVALTGVAGALLAPLYNVYPTMGISLTLNAFAVVVLGGMGNVPGAIAGGLLVGLVQSLAAGYISSGFQDAIVFGVLIAMLIFRPQGILTKVRGEKV